MVDEQRMQDVEFRCAKRHRRTKGWHLVVILLWTTGGSQCYPTLFLSLTLSLLSQVLQTPWGLCDLPLVWIVS